MSALLNEDERAPRDAVRSFLDKKVAPLVTAHCAPAGPMRSRAERGLSVQECARLAVAGARAVLATVSAARSAS